MINRRTQTTWPSAMRAIAASLANLASQLERAPGPSKERARCYALVRRERLIVGPTTAPYPLNHETLLTTSDSIAELRSLCASLSDHEGGRVRGVLQSDNWIDALPADKVYDYAIRRA